MLIDKPTKSRILSPPPRDLLYEYTAISKKAVIVNSRHWNRKELWDSSSTSNLLLLALTLQNIECRFIIMSQPYSYDYT